MSENAIQGDPLSTPIVPPTTSAPATTQGDLYYKGLREVKSSDDMKEYAKELEEKVVALEIINRDKLRPKVEEPTLAPRPIQTQKPNYEELIYTKPQEAAELIKREVKQEIDLELQKKEMLSKFWVEFFEEHKDLRAAERIVKLVKEEKWAEVKDLPLPKAKEFLANEARAITNSIRKSANVTVTEVPQGNTVTLPTSGEGAPKIPTAPQQPKSFAEQIRALKRSKK